MKKTIEIRPRKRPYPKEVTHRHPNGKPMLTTWKLSDQMDSPKFIQAMLRNLERDKGELEDNYPLMYLRMIVDGAIGLLKHYNVADIAKATGVSRSTLYKALKPDWEPTFEVVFRIYWVFGMKLKFSLMPAEPVKKKISWKNTKGKKS